MDQNKNLKAILFLLSQRKEGQIKHLNNLFNGRTHNLDELLLEFEDSRYLWGNYGDEIHHALNNLDQIFNKIDDLHLYNVEDLSHVLWKKIRITSGNIVHEIKRIEEKGIQS